MNDICLELIDELNGLKRKLNDPAYLKELTPKNKKCLSPHPKKIKNAIKVIKERCDLISNDPFEQIEKYEDLTNEFKANQSFSQNYVLELCLKYFSQTLKNEEIECFLKQKLAEKKSLTLDYITPTNHVNVRKLSHAYKSRDVDFFIEWLDKIPPEIYKDSLFPPKLVLVQIANIKFAMEAHKNAQNIEEWLQKAKPFFTTYSSKTEDLKKLIKQFLFSGKKTKKHLGEVTSKLFLRLFRSCLAVNSKISGGCLEDPLITLYLASKQMLPELLNCYSNKIDTKTKKRSAFQYNLKNVTVKANPSLMFHNVFVCPVIKEEIELHDEPVKLPCDHLISLNSFNSLIADASRTAKCPTCPVHFGKSDCKKVSFGQFSEKVKSVEFL